MKRGSKLALMVTAITLVVVAVAAASLLHTCNDCDDLHGSRYPRIDFVVHEGSANWTITVTGVGNMQNPLLTETNMTMRDQSGNVSPPVVNVSLSSLNEANWTTYRVLYVKVNPADRVVTTAAEIVVDKSAYPVGYRLELSVGPTLVAVGYLRP